jgi:hypothetical protein
VSSALQVKSTLSPLSLHQLNLEALLETDLKRALAIEEKGAQLGSKVRRFMNRWNELRPLS